MTMAGELTVTTNRVTRGLADFEAITSLCEEWSKDAHRNRYLLAELERHAHNGADATLKQLSSFHEREQERLADGERGWSGDVMGRGHGRVLSRSGGLDAGIACSEHRVIIGAPCYGELIQSSIGSFGVGYPRRAFPPPTPSREFRCPSQTAR